MIVKAKPKARTGELCSAYMDTFLKGRMKAIRL